MKTHLTLFDYIGSYWIINYLKTTLREEKLMDGIQLIIIILLECGTKIVTKVFGFLLFTFVLGLT